MFQECQRTQTAHLFRFEHLKWKSRVPDEKELAISQFKPDTPLWFKPQSDFAYQHRSTVLVESAFAEDGDALNTRQKDIQNRRMGKDSSGVLRRLELSTAGFFEFLFSNRWKEGCLLRVLPGKLLSNLLHGLVMLEKYHEVITYVTMAHARKPSIYPCMKKNEEHKQAISTARTSKVLVEFEYFCPQENPIASLPSIRSGETSSGSTFSEISKSKTSMTMVTSLAKSEEQTVSQYSSTETAKSLERTVSQYSSIETAKSLEQTVSQYSSIERTTSPEQTVSHSSTERATSPEQTVSHLSTKRTTSPEQTVSHLSTKRTTSLEQTVSHSSTKRTTSPEQTVSPLSTKRTTSPEQTVSLLSTKRTTSPEQTVSHSSTKRTTSPEQTVSPLSTKRTTSPEQTVSLLSTKRTTSPEQTVSHSSTKRTTSPEQTVSQDLSTKTAKNVEQTVSQDSPTKRTSSKNVQESSGTIRSVAFQSSAERTKSLQQTPSQDSSIKRTKSQEKTVNQDSSIEMTKRQEETAVSQNSPSEVISTNTELGLIRPNQSVSFNAELSSKEASSGAMRQLASSIYFTSSDDDLFPPSQSKLQPKVPLTTNVSSKSNSLSAVTTTHSRIDPRTTVQKRVPMTSKSFFVGTSSGSQLTDRHADRMRYPSHTALDLKRFVSPDLHISSTGVSKTNTSTVVHAGSTFSRLIIEDGGDDSTMAFKQRACQEVLSASWGGDDVDVHAEARCNVRGQIQPPGHTTCRMPYHMVREPFYLSRQRHQSAFPPIQVPKPPTLPYVAEAWSDRPEDDDHCGPKEADKSELISSDPILEKYNSVTKSHSTFTRQRADIICAERKSDIKYNLSKDKKKKGKKKGLDQNDISDDEDESTRLWKVDAERMQIFKKDVRLMNSEFFVDKPVRLKNVNTKEKLIKTFRSEEESEPIPIWIPRSKETKKKNLRVKKMPLNSAAGSTDLSKSAKRKSYGSVSSPSYIPKTSTYKVLKKWEKCPNFMEFYYYLNEDDDQSEVQSLTDKPKQHTSLQQKRLIADQTKDGSDKLGSQSTTRKQRRNSSISHQKLGIRIESTHRKSPEKNRERQNKQNYEVHNDQKLSSLPNANLLASFTKEHASSGQDQKQQNYTTVLKGVCENSEDSSGDDCLKFTIKSQSENQLSEQVSLVHTKEKELTKGGDEMNGVTSKLSEEQETECKEAGLLISDIDPWHIYVPDTFLRKDSHDTADIRSGLFRRREMMERLIEGGRMILQVNKTRMWSLVRKVPKELGNASISGGVRRARDSSLKSLKLSKAHIKIKTKAGKEGSPQVHFDEQSEQLSQSDADKGSPAKGVKCKITKTSPSERQHMEMKAGDVPTELTDLSKQTQDLGFPLPQTYHDEDLENITEKQLFNLMKVDEVFNTRKLKHSYSFEKMCSRHTESFPQCRKRLSHYLHPPGLKKGSRDSQYKKLSPKRKKTNSKRGLSAKRTSKLKTPSVHQEESSRDAMHDLEGSKDVQDDDHFTNDMFCHLLLAFKLFMVRKERATSVNPVQSKVSITFSRRPAGMLETEITSILEEASCSRHAVNALCHTLFMH